jgi:hypothetical protein
MFMLVVMGPKSLWIWLIFYTLVSIIIEENNKLIKEQGPYEKNLDLDFQFSISIPIQFDFTPCLIISCAYFLYKYVRKLGLCL